MHSLEVNFSFLLGAIFIDPYSLVFISFLDSCYSFSLVAATVEKENSKPQYTERFRHIWTDYFLSFATEMWQQEAYCQQN